MKKRFAMNFAIITTLSIPIISVVSCGWSAGTPPSDSESSTVSGITFKLEDDELRISLDANGISYPAELIGRVRIAAQAVNFVHLPESDAELLMLLDREGSRHISTNLNERIDQLIEYEETFGRQEEVVVETETNDDVQQTSPQTQNIVNTQQEPTSSLDRGLLTADDVYEAGWVYFTREDGTVVNIGDPVDADWSDGDGDIINFNVKTAPFPGGGPKDVLRIGDSSARSGVLSPDGTVLSATINPPYYDQYDDHYRYGANTSGYVALYFADETSPYPWLQYPQHFAYNWSTGWGNFRMYTRTYDPTAYDHIV